MGPQRTPLDGRRWHWVHGPIELVIGADGDEPAIDAAHERAWQRYSTILQELVTELPQLKRPVAAVDPCPLQGTVARRMWHACAAMPADFITSMAAVAGSVAEELIGCYRADGIRRAWINNGGDIALHLAEGESVRVGLVADIARHRTALDGRFAVQHTDPVRGIATSGWRGRSHSLGIADCVTVLAATASRADAAATVIANAVNVDDARIRRAPASSLKDDSDLGDRLITVDVPALPAAQVERALARGLFVARELHALGLVHDAALVCQGRCLTLADDSAHLPLAA